MARTVTKKRSVKRNVPRGRSAKFMEERHIGSETVNWSEVTDFETAFRDTLRHYGYFYETKDYQKWTKDWFKQNRPKDSKYLAPLEPWRFSPTVASICKMSLNGAQHSGRRLDWFNEKIEELVAAGKEKAKEKKEVVSVATSPRKSPAELVKEKTSEFIAELEGVLDDWERAPEGYSVFSELQKIDAAYVTSKAVADYYAPIRDEIALLVSKKDKDLLEAYESVPIRKRKKYLTFLESIVADAEKYMATKKAIRKTRKKKAPSAGTQVAKVQYLKDSAEFKIASVDPAQIVGATEVWLFNIRYRTLSRLFTSSDSGFTIKGTTIQDVDLDKSSKKKLRKPDEFFAETTKTTKAKMNKTYNAVRTKESPTTGRINSDTVILKVY